MKVLLIIFIVSGLMLIGYFSQNEFFVPVFAHPDPDSPRETDDGIIIRGFSMISNRGVLIPGVGLDSPTAHKLCITKLSHYAKVDHDHWDEFIGKEGCMIGKKGGGMPAMKGMVTSNIPSHFQITGGLSECNPASPFYYEGYVQHFWSKSGWDKPKKFANYVDLENNRASITNDLGGYPVRVNHYKMERTMFLIVPICPVGDYAIFDWEKHGVRFVPKDELRGTPSNEQKFQVPKDDQEKKPKIGRMIDDSPIPRNYGHLTGVSSGMYANLQNCDVDCGSSWDKNQILNNFVESLINEFSFEFIYGKNTQYALSQLDLLKNDVERLLLSNDVLTAKELTKQALTYENAIIATAVEKKVIPLAQEQDKPSYSENENGNYVNVINLVQETAKELLPKIFPELQESYPYSMYVISTEDSFGNVVPNLNVTLSWTESQVDRITDEGGNAAFVGPDGEFNEIIVYPTLDHNNEINPEEFQDKISDITINVQKIDERSAQQPLTIKTNEYLYEPGDSVTVNIDANLPILASISVIDSQQNTILLRSMQIENSKQFSFTIPQNALPEINYVLLTTTINGEQYLISEEIFVTIPESETPPSAGLDIPDWIKNNAEWWAAGQIDDDSFVSGIDYMIKQKIIQIPETQREKSFEKAEIPDWIKNNAGWWSEGLISDKEFASGLEYLIKVGVIGG